MVSLYVSIPAPVTVVRVGPLFRWLGRGVSRATRSAGVPVDAVGIVFCAHLHHDRCGWEHDAGGRSLVVDLPECHLLECHLLVRRRRIPAVGHSGAQVHPNDFNPNTFDECVRPIVDAGLAKVVSTPYVISPGLTIEPAPGHAMGHALIRHESDGVIAHFSGDTFHHPVQLTRPELHLPGRDDLAVAIATRRGLVRRALDEGAFLLPAHFPAPYCSRLSTDGGEVCFVPGGAPEVDTERVTAGFRNAEEIFRAR